MVDSLIMDGGAHGTRLIDVEDGVKVRGGILAIALIQQFISSKFIGDECPGSSGGPIHRTVVGKSSIGRDEAQVDAEDSRPFLVERELAGIV